ncbi:MAG: DUF4347 domain-containing protein [Flavobacteriales bacterium]
MKKIVCFALLFNAIIILQAKNFGINTDFSTRLFVDQSVIGLDRQIDKMHLKEGVFHLFSHGRPGELFIEGKWLNAEQIKDFIILKSMANGENRTTSVIIYGCDFAKGKKGLEAVKYLLHYFPDMVAASTDKTGYEKIGGDWDLEVVKGNNKDSALFYTLKQWRGILQDLFKNPGLDVDLRKESALVLPQGWERVPHTNYIDASPADYYNGSYHYYHKGGSMVDNSGRIRVYGQKPLGDRPANNVYSCVTLVHSWMWVDFNGKQGWRKLQSGLRQTVTGLTVGKSYTISWYQAVTKELPNPSWNLNWNVGKMESTGTFKVYINGVHRYTAPNSTRTSSPQLSSIYGHHENGGEWGKRSYTFKADKTEATIDFVAYDPYNGASPPVKGGTINGNHQNLRMSIDGASATLCPTNTDIIGDNKVCKGSSIDLNLSAGAVGKWSSSDTSTATVNSNTGLVTGIKAGNVTITFTSSGGCTAEKNITVNNSPTLGGASEVCVGEEISVTPNTGGTWSSSEPSIATVSNTGKVTGIKAGTVVLTFTSSSGCSSTKNITVIPQPKAGTGTEVTLNSNTITSPINLFNYLSSPYDTGGIWTETEVVTANLLNGHYWAGQNAEEGTYKFTYTVSGKCNTSSTSTVIIHLRNVCTKPPTTTGPGLVSDVGISTLNRTNKDWLQNVKNGYLVLESKEKGLVITRTTPNLINNAREGMIIWDTMDKCIKLYNGTEWKCIERSCNE